MRASIVTTCHPAWFRALALPVTLWMLSGCMFTQWTDHGYFGSPSDPPSHPNREWAGLAILPLAVAGDIVTAPAQLVALMVSGDYSLYPHRNLPRLGASLQTSSNIRMACAVDGNSGWPAAPAANASRMIALGMDAYGNRTEVALTAPQAVQLIAASKPSPKS